MKLRLGLGLGRNGAGSGGGGLNPAISAPTLTDASATGTTYPPVFDVGLDDTAQVGDVLDLVWKSKAGAVVGSSLHTITSGEATAHAATFTGLSSIASGTYRYTVRVERGGYYSADSNIVIHGPDDIEPVLSLPTSASVATTSATIGCTTDTAEGTLYAVLTLTNSAPSAAQVKAGQNAAGTAAAYVGSAAITTTGAKTFSATGLTSATNYYSWFMHEDATANQSLVSGSSFTTAAAAAFSMTQTANPATQNIGFASTSATFSSQAIGAADSSRKILVTVLMSNGGGNVSGVTVGGIAATQRGSANLNQSFWEAAVPTGTTATVVVSTGSNINYCGCTIVSVIGSTGAPTVHTPLSYGFNNSPQNISVTTPSGGATYVAYEGASLSGTAAFSNATKQSQDSSVGETLTVAIRSTSGAATVGVTGFNNQNCCMSALSYS